MEHLPEIGQSHLLYPSRRTKEHVPLFALIRRKVVILLQVCTDLGVTPIFVMRFAQPDRMKAMYIVLCLDLTCSLDVIRSNQYFRAPVLSHTDRDWDTAVLVDHTDTHASGTVEVSTRS